MANATKRTSKPITDEAVNNCFGTSVHSTDLLCLMRLYPPNPCISAFMLPVPHHPPTSTVPDSAKLHPTLPLPPVNPSAVPSVCGNGKHAPFGGQPQAAPQHLQTLPQQRYPPREIPPRFRQQEHKQLLKRGQPLPSGTLPFTTTGLPATTESAATAAATPSSPSCSSSSTASLPTGQPRHSIGESLPLVFIQKVLKHNAITTLV